MPSTYKRRIAKINDLGRCGIPSFGHFHSLVASNQYVVSLPRHAKQKSAYFLALTVPSAKQTIRRTKVQSAALRRKNMPKCVQKLLLLTSKPFHFLLLKDDTKAPAIAVSIIAIEALGL